MGWSDVLAAERLKAVGEAADALAERGFSQQASGKWTGNLTLPEHSIGIEIVIPSEFPDKLPEIFVANPGDVAVRPHIERSGKICIATPNGNLLDTDRPLALIVDSLDRAKSILSASEKDQKTDVQLEFVAYWPEKHSNVEICSIIDPTRVSGEVVYAPVSLNIGHLIFANSAKDLKQWARKAGATYGEIKTSFFAKLAQLPDPPRFEHAISTKELDTLLLSHMSKGDYEQWKKWDRGRRPPEAILLACELIDRSFTVVAVRSAQLTEAQSRAIENPYNRKKPPAKLVRKALLNNPVRRRGVTRFDLPHLLNRTGNMLDLDGARVAIVGCGAVGSQIAVAAAALGVRGLTLVDHELLAADNIHRHALGAADVNRLKVVALTERIEQRFPNSNIVPRAERIEKVFENTPEIVDDIDVFIFALGDETLERRINSFLGPSVMRLHSWVEPLGIGGHCLIIPGGEQKGCFECLYGRDEKSTIYNMSSLCERGQVFERTTGGCAGTFTPFGYVDTLDIASKTARVLARVLTDKSAKHGLLSWIGDERLFVEAGLRLSKRGEQLTISRESFRDDVLRADCSICAKW